MSIKSTKVIKLKLKIYIFYQLFAFEPPIILIKRWLFIILFINLINTFEIKQLADLWYSKTKHPFFEQTCNCVIYTCVYTKTKHHQAPLAKPVPLVTISPYRSDHSGPFLFFKLCHTLCSVGSVRRSKVRHPTIESHLYTVYAWRTDSKA